MLLQDNIRESIVSILSNKLRSMLTMLGIIIGIASIVIIMSLGKSGQKYIQTQLNDVGVNSVLITWNGSNNEVGNGQLDIKDIDIISHLDGIQIAAPVITDINWLYFDNKENKINTLGITKEYTNIQKLKILYGRFITNTEISNSTKVCLLNQPLAQKLFKDINPVGKTISIYNIDFVIIGVYRLDSSMFNYADFETLIPFKTMNMFRAIDNIDMIWAKVYDINKIEAIKKQITSRLEQKHNRKNIYELQSFESLQNATNQILGGLTIILSIISGISLIVGGIGIMNIMLVSVVERTKEIGIRMAIGATRKDILTQFLIESSVLSMIGGLGGVVISIICLMFIQFITSYMMIISLETILIPVAISFIIGMLFGVYPATRASKLSPIEALRYD